MAGQKKPAFAVGERPRVRERFATLLSIRRKFIGETGTVVAIERGACSGQYIYVLLFERDNEPHFGFFFERELAR